MSAPRAVGAALATVLIVTTAAIALGAHEGQAPNHVATVAATSGGFKWPPFPKSTYWSRPIPANAAVDPRSGTWTNYFRDRLRSNPDNSPLLAIRAYGAPIWVGRAGDPIERIGSCYRYRCNGVAGATLRVPVGATADPGSDGHMVIVDRKRKRSYEFFRAKRVNGQWSGAGAGTASLQRGDGATTGSGPTAAHLSLLAGLVRPSEIRRGQIKHAIGVTIPGIGTGAPRCPARQSVATTAVAGAPPEGTRLQLDPTVDLRQYKLPRLQRIIAVALQRYGMIVNDNGGKIAFRAENFIGKNVDQWTRLGFNGDDSVTLTGIPLDRLRVIAGPTC